MIEDDADGSKKSLAENRNIILGNISMGGQKTKMGTSQRLAEATSSMAGISLGLLPPSYQSINFPPQLEMLMLPFLLSLEPINNLNPRQSHDNAEAWHTAAKSI